MTAQARCLATKRFPTSDGYIQIRCDRPLLHFGKHYQAGVEWSDNDRPSERIAGDAIYRQELPRGV